MVQCTHPQGIESSPWQAGGSVGASALASVIAHGPRLRSIEFLVIDLEFLDQVTIDQCFQGLDEGASALNPDVFYHLGSRHYPRRLTSLNLPLGLSSQDHMAARTFSGMFLAVVDRSGTRLLA